MRYSRLVPSLLHQRPYTLETRMQCRLNLHQKVTPQPLS